MPKLPKLLSSKIVAKSQIFCVESLELEFSNGELRTYERLKAGRNGAVMIIAVNEKQQLILIREYAAGTERYELAFPKGLIENGETPEQAGNRELKEEAGYGAKQLTQLKSFTLAPGYLSHKMYLVFAEELYPEKLVGDEPEPIEVITWPLNKLDELMAQDDFTEARSIAALYMVNDIFQKRADKGNIGH